MRHFNLNRVYLDPLSMSNSGQFFLELNSLGFYSGSKRGRKLRRRMSTSSIKRQTRSVSRRSRAVEVKEMY